MGGSVSIPLQFWLLFVCFCFFCPSMTTTLINVLKKFLTSIRSTILTVTVENNNNRLVNLQISVNFSYRISTGPLKVFFVILTCYFLWHNSVNKKIIFYFQVFQSLWILHLRVTFTVYYCSIGYYIRLSECWHLVCLFAIEATKSARNILYTY